MEAIDHEARDRIAQLEVLTREQGSALWGDNVRRDNGLRSDVRKLEEKQSETDSAIHTVVEKWRHYIDIERADSCPFRGFLTSADDDSNEEETEVKVAEINAQAMLEVAQKNYHAAIRGQVLTVVGLLLVAALQIFGK